MTREEVAYWNGRLSPYDDFSDGAWWAACESEIGGYDKFMDFLLSEKKFNEEDKKKMNRTLTQPR